MQDVLLDAVVETDYGQLTIEWDEHLGGGDPLPHFAGQANGLAGAARPGMLWLILARRSGGSAVRIELGDDEPALEPSAEDVVEVSVSIAEGSRPRWVSWAAEESGPLAIPPGDYRVRVSAWGRDAGQAGEFADVVVDRYLVEFWPSAIRSDAVIRSTSLDAAYWHSAWVSRPSG